METITQEDFTAFQTAKAKFAKAQADFNAAKAKLPTWFVDSLNGQDDDELEVKTPPKAEYVPLDEDAKNNAANAMIKLLTNSDYKEKGAMFKTFVSELKKQQITIRGKDVTDIAQNPPFKDYFEKVDPNGIPAFYRLTGKGKSYAKNLA